MSSKVTDRSASSSKAVQKHNPSGASVPIFCANFHVLRYLRLAKSLAEAPEWNIDPLADDKELRLVREAAQELAREAAAQEVAREISKGEGDPTSDLSLLREDETAMRLLERIGIMIRPLPSNSLSPSHSR